MVHRCCDHSCDGKPPALDCVATERTSKSCVVLQYKGEASETGASGITFKAASTNALNFPRIEIARDSFGNESIPITSSDSKRWVSTGHVIRPGSIVEFRIHMSDPNGDDGRLESLTSGGTRPKLSITDDGLIKWLVQDRDIGDPTEIHFYLASQRPFHRHNSFDDAASFTYRVLPRQ